MSTRDIRFRSYDLDDYAGLTLIDSPETVLSLTQFLMNGMTV